MESVITLPKEVLPALIIVISVILVDVVLGILLKVHNNEFEPELLPKFLVTGVVPYIGGLVVLGLVAEFVGVFFISFFYMAATAVVVKYVADVRKKIMSLFVSEK
jgi:hypothetical protein